MDPDNEAMSSEQEEILDTLHWLAMPVVVVAAAANSERSCATGTLSYVSLQPPMISTSLAGSSRTYQLAISRVNSVFRFFAPIKRMSRR